MSRIYLPATGPSDWQRLLAQPEKHWKMGYSARALADCWHAAARFPPEVEAAFAASGHPALREFEPLIMLPEHKVPLPGRGPASQNDLWVLARTDAGLVSIAVEGKVNEPFDQPLSEWLNEASPEKRKRLVGLSALLGLTVQPPPTTRYQLMHRTASALIEARRFHAQTAVLLVHSFSQMSMWHSDYMTFATLFGATGAIGVFEDVGVRDGIRLFLGWVTGDAHFLGQ